MSGAELYTACEVGRGLLPAEPWADRHWRGKRGFVGACLMAAAMLGAGSLLGQEALRNSLAGDAAIALRRTQAEVQPYTYKSGDFRLLVTPSLGLEYNDNIAITDGDQREDFILQPFVDLTATYPITKGNLLRLRLGLGY